MSLKRGMTDAIKSNDNGKVWKFLEKVNAEAVNGKNESGELATSIHEACRTENSQALTHLLTLPGIDVNVKDSSGMTPLHVACQSNNSQVLTKLRLTPGIDLNARNIYDMTPILISAAGCRNETLGIMLDDAFVDLDAKDNDGRGLEELVASNSSEIQKNKCLKMIKEAKLKRNREMVRETNYRTNLRKIIRNIRYSEQKSKEKLAKRKVKIGQLKKEQILEKSTSSMKQGLEERTMLMKQRDEDIAMQEKHRNELMTLRDTFRKEVEDEEQSLANLREKADQLERDFDNQEPVSSKDTCTLEAARGNLECPVCLEIMKPPTRIWMCPLSHIICEPCKDQLKGGLCPTCTTEKVTLRAFVAENFARTIFNE